MNQKLERIIRLIRQRDETIVQLATIDKEIDAVLNGGRRGAPFKYTGDDESRVLGLSEKGMSGRKISQQTGISHSTVDAMIKRGRR